MEIFYTWKALKLADVKMRGSAASSITVNPWSMPVTIKEISFHRSLNNRSIKLFCFRFHHPGSILHANCPIHFGAMTFYNHSWNGCSCIITFMRHFPVSVIPAASTKTRGIFSTISHAIYVWCTKSNPTGRKISIACECHRLDTPPGRWWSGIFSPGTARSKGQIVCLPRKRWNVRWHELCVKSPLNCWSGKRNMSQSHSSASG